MKQQVGWYGLSDADRAKLGGASPILVLGMGAIVLLWLRRKRGRR